jgi:hypothetical protein
MRRKSFLVCGIFLCLSFSCYAHSILESEAPLERAQDLFEKCVDLPKISFDQDTLDNWQAKDVISQLENTPIENTPIENKPFEHESAYELKEESLLKRANQLRKQKFIENKSRNIPTPASLASEKKLKENEAPAAPSSTALALELESRNATIIELTQKLMALSKQLEEFERDRLATTQTLFDAWQTENLIFSLNQNLNQRQGEIQEWEHQIECANWFDEQALSQELAKLQNELAKYKETHLIVVKRLEEDKRQLLEELRKSKFVAHESSDAALINDNLKREIDKIRQDYLQQGLALTLQENALKKALEDVEHYKGKIESFNISTFEKEITRLNEKMQLEANQFKLQYEGLMASLEAEKAKSDEFQNALSDVDSVRQAHELRIQELVNELQATQIALASKEERIKPNLSEQALLEKIKLLQSENEKLSLELNNLKFLSNRKFESLREEFERKELIRLEQSRKDLEEAYASIEREKKELLQKFQEKKSLENDVKYDLERISNELATYKRAYEKSVELLDEAREEMEENNRRKDTLLASMEEELYWLKAELASKEIELQTQRFDRAGSIDEQYKEALLDRQELTQNLANLKIQAMIEKEQLRSEIISLINKNEYQENPLKLRSELEALFE